jgi:ABC transporter substrate binding protein
MQELGYLEGKTVTFDERWAHGQLDRLPGLAKDLVRQNVDVIVAIGTSSVRVAMEATRTIPIVMGSGVDPVEAGFVTSLTRPGGNVTGVSILAPVMSAKRLDILKQAIPGITRVGVLGYRANTAATAAQVTAIEAVAASLKLTIPAMSNDQADTRSHSPSSQAPGRARSWCSLTACSPPSECRSCRLQSSIAYRSFSTSARAPKPVASFLMASTTWTSTARRPAVGRPEGAARNRLHGADAGPGALALPLRDQRPRQPGDRRLSAD